MALNVLRPSLHGEGASNWMIAAEVLEFLGTHVGPESVTMETGAGYSTIACAQRGAAHTSITPARAEADAILDHCAAEGIATDRVRFLIGCSQEILPTLPVEEVDLALIDGGHGFPIPAVDFLYLAPLLRVGGHLLIDDIDIWTGAMVVDFLKKEPGWSFEGSLARRTAVFRKTADFEAREWCDQPAVVARSRVGRLVRQAANGTERLLRGDLAGLRDSVGRAVELRRQRHS